MDSCWCTVLEARHLLFDWLLDWHHLTQTPGNFSALTTWCRNLSSSKAVVAGEIACLRLTLGKRTNARLMAHESVEFRDRCRSTKLCVGPSKWRIWASPWINSPYNPAKSPLPFVLHVGVLRALSYQNTSTRNISSLPCQTDHSHWVVISTERTRSMALLGPSRLSPLPLSSHGCTLDRS